MMDMIMKYIIMVEMDINRVEEVKCIIVNEEMMGEIWIEIEIDIEVGIDIDIGIVIGMSRERERERDREREREDNKYWNKPVTQWNSNDIYEWIIAIDNTFKRYKNLKHLLNEQEIIGNDLKNVTEENIKKDFEIKSFGDKKLLFSKIQEIIGNNNGNNNRNNNGNTNRNNNGNNNRNNNGNTNRNNNGNNN
eukprot:551484_1